jgi:hypothetical protein
MAGATSVMSAERPLVRAREGQEVDLESYRQVQQTESYSERCTKGWWLGCPRGTIGEVESVVEGYGIGRLGGSRTGFETTVSGGDRRIESTAIRCGRRNVKEYLPENCQRDYDRRMRNAYAMSSYAEAKAALEKIFRQLERINPSAARSLEEGLEVTLTVHRLGIGAVLRRKLATTNPIESCLSTVQRVARNVKRWREGNQPLRWTATGLLEAEKKFRRIKGYQELLLLKERLNPSRTQQKEVRTLEVA